MENVSSNIMREKKSVQDENEQIYEYVCLSFNRNLTRSIMIHKRREFVPEQGTWCPILVTCITLYSP